MTTVMFDNEFFKNNTVSITVFETKDISDRFNS